MAVTADRIHAAEILAKKIRRDVLEEMLEFGSGHVGGSLSIADLMAVLYSGEAQVDPNNPKDPSRDRIILSKGHAGPAWYAALAERGFFSKDWLMTLNKSHTNLPSHPDRTKTPGVDATTGSLGQGTSVAAGIAYALRLQNNPAYTYLICGDGELDEGQCWEAFQFIAHYKLNHLIVIIDENKKQLDGYTKDVINPQDIAEKMRAFGFSTQRVDGQSAEAILCALQDAKQITDKPSCIVLSTTKGAGVPYFAELMNNHSVVFSGDARDAAQEALAVFNAELAAEEA